MNVTARLTPGVVAAAIVMGTLYGPLMNLQDITRDNLTSLNYWLDMLAHTLSSFGGATVTVGAAVAAALGLPMWTTRKDGSNAPSDSNRVDQSN